MSGLNGSTAGLLSLLWISHKHGHAMVSAWGIFFSLCFMCGGIQDFGHMDGVRSEVLGGLGGIVFPQSSLRMVIGFGNDEYATILGGLIVGSDQGGCGREGVQMGHFGR
jgi:hypothetical protein